jgi:glyceraldehyde 3-phosphate dehydrogenase
MRVAINGFGRIGRLVARRWLSGAAPEIEIVAVNDLVPADNLAYLLQHDTTHGRFAFPVTAEENALCCNGRRIQITAVKDPTQLPWREMGVDLVLECTGLFTEKGEAEKHLSAGAQRVIISAPAKGGVPTFVMGVNEQHFNPAEDRVLSNASCTTNCLAPVAKVLHEAFGIEEALMTTVHAVTATQPTVDGPSKKDWRGGRAAGYNIIPASTGAAQAVTLCLPALKGKITGMALRVPVLDVSVVDLTVRTEKETSYDALMAAFDRAAEHELKGILSVSREELVSSDFIGNPMSAIVDVGAGIELSSRFFKIVAWYDNEMGYAARLLDLASYVAKRSR